MAVKKIFLCEYNQLLAIYVSAWIQKCQISYKCGGMFLKKHDAFPLSYMAVLWLISGMIQIFLAINNSQSPYQGGSNFSSIGWAFFVREQKQRQRDRDREKPREKDRDRQRERARERQTERKSERERQKDILLLQRKDKANANQLSNLPFPSQRMSVCKSHMYIKIALSKKISSNFRKMSFFC